MSTVYLIDASPYIFRAYFALPTTITSPDGFVNNAVYGYTDFLIQILKKENPTHIAVTFDGSLTTSFRNEIYPDYKANRSLPPTELEDQLDACFQVTEAMGMPAFIDDKYESDDIIGTLTNMLLKNNFNVVIVSSDKDFTQLVNTKVLLFDYARNQWYDEKKIEQKFGVPPKQIIDFMALTGDAVDNIPGVKGIGPKTASTLLNHFSSVEEIYKNLDNLEKLSIRGIQSIKDKLIADREIALISRTLATIAIDAPVEVDLCSLKYSGPNQKQIEKIFIEHGFDALKERIPERVLQ